jgi:hypothetical protein
MEDEHEQAAEQPTPERGEVVSEPARSSLKAWLVSTREQIVEKKTYEMPLPGFGGRLVAVYRAPGEKMMQRIGKRNEHAPDHAKNLLLCCDVLTGCCEDVYATEGDERVSLGPWSPAMVKQHFEIDNPGITTPRSALLAIYATDELHFLIVKHFNTFVERIEDDAPEVVAELGEDSALSTSAS